MSVNRPAASAMRPQHSGEVPSAGIAGRSTEVMENGDVEADTRRDLALRAAVIVADRFGLPFDEPSIIADANNTIVGIGETVAKVSTTTRAWRTDTLDRELAVLSHLAPSGDGGPHG